MKRLRTWFGTGITLLATLVLLPTPHALAGQQTFSSVSSGKAPAPAPTPTSLNLSGIYLGIGNGYGPHHPHRPPCVGYQCPPPSHLRPPATTSRPVVPPRPMPLRP
jgi:hypothetical protein